MCNDTQNDKTRLRQEQRKLENLHQMLTFLHTKLSERLTSQQIKRNVESSNSPF